MALFLTDDDVRHSITMGEAIAALREAFARPSTVLPRWRGVAPEGTVGVYNVMAASLPSLGYMGLKSYPWVKGSPTHFHVMLYGWESATLEALIEGDYLGRIRTGAASGLATDLLARKDAHRMACIGSGTQAFAQVEGVLAVREIEQVCIFSRREPRRQALAERVRSELGAETIVCDSAEHAISGADVITTITSASTPVVLGTWLTEGMHINAAGSNVAQHRELDEDAVLRADRIVVDAKAEAEAEAGDLIPLERATRVSWTRIHELADIVSGRVPARVSDREITLFESQGVAVEDVAVAAHVLANARRLGLGRELPVG